MTLPLSYSRLRGSLYLQLPRRYGVAGTAFVNARSARNSGDWPADILSAGRSFCSPLSARAKLGGSCPVASLAISREAKGYGEGRTRTFEAARATDLQSAAFDRFATSPAVCVVETRCFLTLTVTRIFSNGGFSSMELAKGFEPPTG